jgi:hypothetical protein
MKCDTLQENKQILGNYPSAGMRSVNVGFEVLTVVTFIFSDVMMHGLVENLPMFWRNVLPPSLRSNSKLKKQPASMFLHKVSELLPEDITLDK